MPLQKLSEIEEKLRKDYIDIKHRYIKLKRCKYALLILKTTLLSLSIGLSFLNPTLIIVSSTVPIIDSIMLITNKDKEVSHLKLQKYKLLFKLLRKFILNDVHLKTMKRLKNTF